MAVRFFLHKRTAKRSAERSLRLVISRGGRQMYITTPIRVKPSDWSQSAQRLRASVPGATELNGELQRLRHTAQGLVLRHPEDHDLKVELESLLGKKHSESQRSITELYAEFLEHKATRVKPSTLQVYEALRGHLDRFLSNRPDMVSDVGQGWLDAFVSDLLSVGLANSTVNKLRTRSRGFLTWLERMEHIDSAPKAEPLKTAENDVIHLTLDELTALRSVDLSELPEGLIVARDLFLFGCYTGMRFSDVNQLNRDDIRDTAWYLREQKTNVTRRIPLSDPALEMIERYHDLPTPLPRLSNQKSNKYIKEVARLAGITAPVTIRSQKGGIVESETVPKCDQLSMHAARRTFVTLMIDHGLSTKEMLGVTHSDLRSLERYARADEERLRRTANDLFGSEPRGSAAGGK